MICDIGGGQFYILNKSKVLREQGYDVQIISHVRGKILIDDFKQYENLICEELMYPPNYYSNLKKDSLIESIINKLKNCKTNTEKIIIESHHESVAFWGELLASKIHAKHIIYFIGESCVKFSPQEMDFIKFKDKRKELYVVSKHTYEQIYNEKLEDIDISYLLWSALAFSSVTNSNNVLVDSYEKKEVNIGSIGRLDKPFVNNMIDNIIIFAQKHSEISVGVLLAGGAVDKRIEEDIFKRLSDQSNIFPVITGYIVPLPMKIFELMDVFISSSSSANISYQQNVPTIAIDAEDYEPIGVLGFNTTSVMYRNSNSKSNICQYLEKIFFEKFCEKHKYVRYNYEEFDSYKEYLKQLSAIEELMNLEINNQYYNVGNLHLCGSRLVKLIIFKLLGAKHYYKLKTIHMIK